MLIGRSWLAAGFLLALSLDVGDAANGSGRPVRIVNDAGVKVDLYWINRWENDARVLNSVDGGLFAGTETMTNSHVGHEFEIVELPSKKTGTCGGENNECRIVTFQVNDNDDQVVIIMEGVVLKHVDNKSLAREKAASIVQECKARAAEQTGDVYEILEELTACMTSSVNQSLAKTQEEVDFESNLRSNMGERLGAYACSDDTLNTTDAIENRTWTYDDHLFNSLPVKVLLDRPASRIQVVERFITPEECSAVTQSIKLERVEGENGLWAEKGGIAIPLDETSDVLTELATRIYVFAQDELDIPLYLGNAEDMYELRYVGHGADHPTQDQYLAHCDSPCDGSLHQFGTRIASMILYCNEPEQGGATHFPNAGVHVKPEKGSALFYSYFDPAQLTMDTGFTKHSGCPVTEGEKVILTHKIRSLATEDVNAE